MNKFWALIISTNGLTRMWLSNDNVIELMKNEYMMITDVYRMGNDQKAVLTAEGTIVWQDVPSQDYKVG